MPSTQPSADPQADPQLEGDFRPPGRPALRAVHWPEVSEETWQDWRWQQQNAVRSVRDLARFLPIPAGDVERLAELETRFKLAIPPYYLNLIDPADPRDPILLQSVPDVAEADDDSLEDPLEEDRDSPVPGLTHRYPDRVLMLTTPVCSMYCRYCTRKRVTLAKDGWDAPSHDEERMLEYVRAHPEIHDVILSGGDPLMLKPRKLEWFLASLDAIEHVGIVRIGTRVPITLPQRLFDNELIELLARYPKVWIQTHFNHPAELTPEAHRACRALVRAGMPLNNHSVMLAGVNDSVETMRALVRGLLRMKVRPYYVFHCDPVVGASHFRTSVWKGLEIIEGLRGHVSGLAVPTYVIDGLHGTGKIPVMPNYVLSASKDAVVLRNYEGVVFRYGGEGRVAAPPEAAQATGGGVSGVLAGQRGPLVPAGTERLVRRERRAASEDTERTVSLEPALRPLPHVVPPSALAPPALAAVPRDTKRVNGYAARQRRAQP